MTKIITNIKKIVPRYAYYRKIADLSDSPIDDVVIVFYKTPSSFTGEDLIEVSCHGGDVVAKKIIHNLITALNLELEGSGQILWLFKP